MRKRLITFANRRRSILENARASFADLVRRIDSGEIVKGKEARRG